MRFPDFLIIGAMKAGTTTLFRDLMPNPQVYFPIDKEPECLCHDRVLSEKGRREYAGMFAKTKPGQLCAEASTAYTKRPTFEGVSARALEVLGPDTRLLYVIRDPIKRIVSQHRHEVAVGRLEPPKDINEAVHQVGRYIEYSRYAWQLEPWIETFGPEHIRVVVLEQYIRARAQTLTAACEFLGITPTLDGLDEDKVYNKGDDRRVARGPWRYLLEGRVYKRLVRPMMSIETRQRLHRVFLPKAPLPLSTLGSGTEQWLREQLASDTTTLKRMLTSTQLLLTKNQTPLEHWT